MRSIAAQALVAAALLNWAAPAVALRTAPEGGSHGQRPPPSGPSLAQVSASAAEAEEAEEDAGGDPYATTQQTHNGDVNGNNNAPTHSGDPTVSGSGNPTIIYGNVYGNVYGTIYGYGGAAPDGKPPQVVPHTPQPTMPPVPKLPGYLSGSAPDWARERPEVAGAPEAAPMWDPEPAPAPAPVPAPGPSPVPGPFFAPIPAPMPAPAPGPKNGFAPGPALVPGPAPAPSPLPWYASWDPFGPLPMPKEQKQASTTALPPPGVSPEEPVPTPAPPALTTAKPFQNAATTAAAAGTTAAAVTAVATTAAPQPTTTAQQTLQTSVTIQNVDYNEVASDPALAKGVQDAVSSSVAKVANVAPSSVTTALQPGSIQAVSTILFPPGAPAADFNRAATDIGQALTSGALGSAIQSAVADVSGIDAAATGAIAVSGQMQAAPAADAATTTPLVLPEEEHTCTPACIEGHGICEEGLCFCRHPYSGEQCEKQAQGWGFRLNMGIASLVVCIGGLLGVGVGVMLFMAYQNLKAPATFVEENAQRETWKVAGAGGK